VRCFIALPLPAEARAALAKAAERLKAAWPELKWTRPEAYHMTLAFLGDIDGKSVECAKAAIDAAAAARPIELSFEGLGGFPPHGPWRVLVALAEDDGAAAIVHELVNEALARHERTAGVGPLNPEWPDGKAFRPHVTLARSGGGARPAGGLGPGIKPGPGFDARPGAAPGPGTAPGPRELEALLGEAGRRALAGSWILDRCVLFKSELRSSGAVYTELKSVRLGSDDDPIAGEDR
jgi:RNA 2',3'-cyclic 3'-phosphodiesterase